MLPCFIFVLFLRKLRFELFQFKSKAFTLLLLGLLNSDSNANGHADHGVVAGTIQLAIPPYSIRNDMLYSTKHIQYFSEFLYLRQMKKSDIHRCAPRDFQSIQK